MMKTLEEFVAGSQEGSQSSGEDPEDEDYEYPSFGHEGSADSETHWSESDSEGESGSVFGSEGGGADESIEYREYAGDMFIKRHPIRFTSEEEQPTGCSNTSLNVHEYVCFSLWRNGGNDVRYCRLKDTIIPIPPVSTDQRFYSSHSCMSVYYLGQETLDSSKKPVLVVISLRDFSYKTYDLSGANYDFKHLRNSSLIMNDKALSFQHIQNVRGSSNVKQISCYSVLDLEKKEIVWRLDNVERVFFKAQKKPDDFIKFGQADKKDRKAKSKSWPSKPEKIFAVKMATEEIPLEVIIENEEDKQQLIRALTKDNRQFRNRQSAIQEVTAPRTEIRHYFRTYEVEFGQ